MKARLAAALAATLLVLGLLALGAVCLLIGWSLVRVLGGGDLLAWGLLVVGCVGLWGLCYRSALGRGTTGTGR